MLVGSAPSGALAQRIGPRLQLTVGPLLAAAGLLLLTRIGPDAEWFPDVFPGALVFGLGLVTFVAPLTATVMASADQRHVSVASGVNNAIARAASLTALAVIPAVAGLADADRRRRDQRGRRHRARRSRRSSPPRPAWCASSASRRGSAGRARPAA